MREFERAIERGEDTTVATFVLGELRKIVRGTETTRTRPRTDDPARLLFRPLEPFLVEGNFPRPAGSDPARLAGCRSGNGWSRDGAPEQVQRIRGGAGNGARNRTSSAARGRGPQLPARRGRCDRPSSPRRASAATAARAGPRRPARRDRGSAARSASVLQRPRGPRHPQWHGCRLICGLFGEFADHLDDRSRSTFPRCRRRNCCRSRCRW